MRTILRWTMRLVLPLLVLLAGPAATVATGMADVDQPWWQGRRGGSFGHAPTPEAHPDAVVQVYGARTRGWRGAFAVHTWLAMKPEGADAYTRYEVIGWRYFRGTSPLAEQQTAQPDGWWFGSAPALLLDLRGGAAEAAIPRIREAVASYAYPDFYRTWPGPNSNTFTAHVGRSVPELGLDLPPTAIGKDFRLVPVDLSPSGGGLQFSILGALGVLVSPEEGLEVNVLGLSLGIDPLEPALRLPGLGLVWPGRE
ncbi:MAG: DUF3750 domain-containing protein [Acetobacterales bacterium]